MIFDKPIRNGTAAWLKEMADIEHEALEAMFYAADPYLSSLVQKANGAMAQEAAPEVDKVSRQARSINSVDDGRIHAQLAVAGF